MTYSRVAPRDIFNEANFLKCLGHLAMLCVDEQAHGLKFNEERYREQNIEFFLSGDSGDLHISGEWFTINDKPLIICRPVNSRESWPIFVFNDFEVIDIFNDEGALSAEFITFIEEVKKYA